MNKIHFIHSTKSSDYLSVIQKTESAGKQGTKRYSTGQSLPIFLFIPIN